MPQPKSQAGEENVLNILVIQEPSDWEQTVSGLHPNQAPKPVETALDDKRELNGKSGKAESSNSRKSLYRSQSFVIDIAATHRDPSVEMILASKGKSSLVNENVLENLDFVSSAKQTISVDAAIGTISGKNWIDASRFSAHHSRTPNPPVSSSIEHVLQNSQSSIDYALTLSIGSTPGCKLVKQKSMPAMMENQSSACILKKELPKVSSSEDSPHSSTSSSSLYCSPALGSGHYTGRVESSKTVTPNFSTTPDSGFCTPSLSEPSSVNAFFTSTPRSSKSGNPKTSTPNSAETPKGRTDALQQKFSELYNAVDWESFDDSCDWSEDPKEDDSEGFSPNSSLKSVQWLKNFSVGDSVKPLLSSSPSCSESESSGKTVTDATTSDHFQVGNNKGQDEPSPLSLECVSGSVTRNSLTSCSNSKSFPPPSATAVVASPPITAFPSSILTPLPVIMAPKVPSYLQSQLTASPRVGTPLLTRGQQEQGTSVCPSGDTTTSSSSTSSKRSSRKALEELKMNKAERNIGRSKNTGKIFTRPGYSYMDLIKMAMQTSEDGEMTLREIVSWIEDHFPFFKHEAKHSWKSTIRYNLSLHRDFTKADDRKQRGKWKLCKDAKVKHHKIHHEPPEWTSLQTAAVLKKTKRNAPQPILPKVNTYALVPIHNLANPGLDPNPPQQHQQQAMTRQQQPVALLPRKPVHILPKQMDDKQQQICLQHASLLEDPLSQHPFLSQHQQPLMDHYQAFQTVGDSDGGGGLGNPGGRGGMVSTTSYCSMTAPASMSVCRSDPLRFGHSVVPDNSQTNGGTNGGGDLYDLNGFPYLPKNHNFPLDSVIEIREGIGAQPGEKKIIFVLQDTKNGNKQAKVRMPSKTESTNSHHACPQNVSKQPSSHLKTSTSFGSQKKSKDGSGHRTRRARGPVLNLQSVLEDRKASDKIGQLLQEEDEGRDGTINGRGGKGLDSFTGLQIYPEGETKSYSNFRAGNGLDDAERNHLNFHMEKAFQEQNDNLYKSMMMNQMSGFLPEDEDSNSNSNSITHSNPSSCGTSVLNSNAKRAERREKKMTVMKNRNHSSDSFDLSLLNRSDAFKPSNLFSSSSVSNPAAVPSASQRAFRRLSSSDQGYSSTISVSSFSSSSSSVATPCASQLVFPRLSSGDHHHSLSLSPNSSRCSTPMSTDMSHEDFGGKDHTTASSHRRVGSFSRSKSRRKQVHVPLTNEVSPLRHSKLVVEESRGTRGRCRESCGPSSLHHSPDKLLVMKQYSLNNVNLSVSLSTEIQQPSLEILQQKPLEHNMIQSLREDNNYYSSHTEESMPGVADIFYPEFQHVQQQTMEVNDIETIFCSGSPVKIKGDKTPSEGNVSTDNCPSLSDFETPPSLHFFSTFAKETDFFQVMPSPVSCRDSKAPHPSHHLLDKESMGHCNLSPTGGFPIPNFLFNSPSNCNSNADNTAATSSFISQKRICREDNSSRGYSILHSSHSNSSMLLQAKDSTSSSSDFMGASSSFTLGNYSTSMDTPPCGTRLYPTTSRPPPPPSSRVVTSTGRDRDTTSTITPDTKPFSVVPASTHHQQQVLSFSPHWGHKPNPHHYHQIPPPLQQQALCLSPPPLPPPHSLTTSTSSLPLVSEGDGHRDEASSYYSYCTPPCGSVLPLFMSTPTHPSSSSPSHHQELFPLPLAETLPTMLDASFIENLDSYINSLPGHSGATSPSHPHFLYS